VLLLCSLLLVMRIGGTHWHLCFDGQEPPVSIHVADSSFEHSATGVESQHHDQNVEIGLASLVKHGSADFDLPPLVFAVLLLWAVFPRLTVPRTRKALAPPFSDLSLLLPPLRGPPAIAIS
jgi:hypothetical protein